MIQEGQHHMKAQDGLKEIQPGTVHLVNTSPPFNRSILYDEYDDELELAAYIEMIHEVFAEVYEVLVDGGRCVVDIPPVIKYGDQRIDMHVLYSTILEGVGLKFRDCLYWLKARRSLTEATRYNSTNWGTWCSPRNPSPRSFLELLLVFCKGRYDLLDGEEGGSDLEKHEFPTLTNSIWLLPGRADPRHPACFPQALAERVIKLYTYVGNTVVDPFAGIGTTLLAAKKLGRMYYGFDVSENYCKIANGALSQQLITGF